jgi:DNA repair protein RecO (recombination protein O)
MANRRGGAAADAHHGLVAAYVAGARGRALRPVLIPGNLVAAESCPRRWAPAQARVELVASRGPWLAEPLPSAGIAWACALTAAALPEGLPCPRSTPRWPRCSMRSAWPLGARLGTGLDGYERLLLREVAMAAAGVARRGGLAALLARLDARDRRLQANCLPNGAAMLWRPARFCSNG